MTANNGREVVVDVDRDDAGRLQGVALQVQRPRPVGAGPPLRGRAALLPCPRRARSGGWLARTVVPSAPGAGKEHPLRTPADAGGADAARGRTWNGGPASIPGP